MKVITLDGLKTFLDELLGKIAREVYSKSESDKRYQEKIHSLNFGMKQYGGRPRATIETNFTEVDFNRSILINGKLVPTGDDVQEMIKDKTDKTSVYSKTEADARFALKGEGGGSVDRGYSRFAQWLKERNYDVDHNFAGLADVFPEKTLPPLEAKNLAGGDTTIAGTCAPNVVVEYGGVKTTADAQGSFSLVGVPPLEDGSIVELTWYDYAGRAQIGTVTVGEIEYAVPDTVTIIDVNVVEKYNLNRAGKLVFPESVSSVESDAFPNKGNATHLVFLGLSVASPALFTLREKLKIVELPICKCVEMSAFGSCKSLEIVKMPLCATIEDFAFLGSANLKEVILSEQWVPTEDAGIPDTATVYNPDKTKKVDWSTMSWVSCTPSAQAESGSLSIPVNEMGTVDVPDGVFMLELSNSQDAGQEKFYLKVNSSMRLEFSPHGFPRETLINRVMGPGEAPRDWALPRIFDTVSWSTEINNYKPTPGQVIDCDEVQSGDPPVEHPGIDFEKEI